MCSCVCAAPFVLTHLGSYGGASALARRSLGPLRQQVTRPEKSARLELRHTRSICWQAALPTGGGAQRHKLPSATLSLYSHPVGVLSPPLSSKRASSIFSIQSSI